MKQFCYCSRTNTKFDSI